MLLMQIVAWVAAGLVFMTFFMKTIIPLRQAAIASNLVFICYGLMGLNYGIFDKVLPILVLHVSLLPLNIIRLREVQRTIRAVHNASHDRVEFAHLIPFMKPEKFSRGEFIFRRGDPADRLLLLHKGRIRLIELDKLLESGSVIGEVGVFAKNAVRSGTVRCEDDCELFSLGAEKALELFYQDSRFGFFIVQSLAQYLSDEIKQAGTPR